MLNLPLLTKKSTDRFPKVGKKDKSMHNEIRAFYAHMALTHERRFVRCFCLDSENIASDISCITRKCEASAGRGKSFRGRFAFTNMQGQHP